MADELEFSPISLSVIRDRLGPHYESYVDGLMGRRSDNFCSLCKKYYKEKFGEFYPHCTGSALDQLKGLESSGMSDDEIMYLKSTIDPVTWAALELRWHADWYQAQVLRCSSLGKVCRLGRRSGKTDALCVDALHKAMTRPRTREFEEYTVLIITPYEAQINRIFSVLRNFIARSENISGSVVSDVKNPQCINFSNKSQIKGYTAGVKSGNRSEKIRGEDAHAILLDEADLLTQDDLEAILAIKASHPKCDVLFSTTPSGRRETFYSICMDKTLRFKEFWRVSLESPRYTAETDEMLRGMNTEAGYKKEMLAMFGDLSEGVYQRKYVDSAIVEYQYGSCYPIEDRMYLMGVDWNDHKWGTHVVVNEYDKESDQFRVVDKVIVRGEEYTQLKSIQKIIDMNERWQPKYIALDSGYGTTNEEILRFLGSQSPSTGFLDKLTAYNMSSKVVIRDPATGIQQKKHIKPLMIDWSVMVLERGMQVFPKLEDNEKAKGLVHQIRTYMKERISPDGRPVYSQGYDHTLTAWALTLLTFMLNETMEFSAHARDARMYVSSRGSNGSLAPDEPEEDIDGFVLKTGTIDNRFKELRVCDATRGGHTPKNRITRKAIASMRRSMRPSSRSTF